MSITHSFNRHSYLLEVPHENCAHCHNAMGIFRCHGCEKAFCEEHSAQHRAELKHRLDEIRRKNSQLEKDLKLKLFHYSVDDLTRQIDDWERQSMSKVQQAAEDARRKVSEMLSSGTLSQAKELFECRQIFTNRLEEAARSFDYHELNLDYWNQFLEDLKVNFQNLKCCIPHIEFYPQPFIQKINIDGKSLKLDFTKWCVYQRQAIPFENIKRIGATQQVDYHEPCAPMTFNTYFQENEQQPFMHDAPYPTISPLNNTTCEPLPMQQQNFHQQRDQQIIELDPSTYEKIFLDNPISLSTGDYHFHLSTGSIFIGIISQDESINKPLSLTRSTYGWAGNSHVYRGKASEDNERGGFVPMEAGDRILFSVNCELNFIRLTNLSRHTATHELSVDPRLCPLPWRFKVHFVN